MKVGKFHFGTIKIDGVTYERDVVNEVDFAATRFALHLVHHLKRSVSSGADYEPSAPPGCLLKASGATGSPLSPRMSCRC